MEIINLPYSEDSSQIFTKLKHLPWAVLLDSCQPHGAEGRYDIFSADPTVKLITHGAQTELITRTDANTSDACPFSLVHEALGAALPNDTDLPFVGGALGYFSYDLGRRIEKISDQCVHDLVFPDMAIGIYDWAIVVDHVKESACVVAQYKDSHTSEIVKHILELLENNSAQSEQKFNLETSFEPNITFDEYAIAFDAIKNYLVEGDCYQTNLAQRFQAQYNGSVWDAFTQLRLANQAPYSAYLNYPFAKFISCSPERFISVKNGIVETKPIKGTRQRSADPAVDHQLGLELLASEKDRAENLMIVDLMRNDIGKICETGSVKVPELFALESFPAVHHLVSTVTGKLPDDKNAIDLLRACFPGGSITGAPKVRAMEIIEELEKHRRNIYCGSIGYISFDGNMDTCITIRTLTFLKNKVYYSAGGAIVADSELHDEYEESLLKAKNVFRILEEIQ